MKHLRTVSSSLLFLALKQEQFNLPLRDSWSVFVQCVDTNTHKHNDICIEESHHDPRGMSG